MRRKRKPYVCDYCAKKDGRHAEGCLRVVTDATTERWRYLLPSQREAVIEALAREEKRLMNWARLMRLRGSGHSEFARHKREAAMHHAANAGACRVLREMLDVIGGHP